MNRFTLQSYSENISVTTNIAEVYRFFHNDPFPHSLIPTLSVKPKHTKSKYSLSILKSDRHHASFQKSHMKILTPEREVPLYQLVFILQTLFARIMEERGVYMMHSGAVSFNKKGILILAEEYGGKSTLILELCRNYGFEYIGDESTIVDLNEKLILAGNKVITQKNIGKLAQNPSHFYPDQLKIKQAKYPVDISYILRIHLNSLSRIYQPIDSFNLAILIYRNITDQIRGRSAMLINAAMGLPSLDQKTLSRSRLKRIDPFSHNTKAWQIAGNKVWITNKIITQLSDRCKAQ